MPTVHTAQIGRYGGADRLDITIKSAPPEGRPFAPDRWDLVLGAKRGTISPREYREYYTALMVHSQTVHPTAWAALLARDRVTLLCYCAPTFRVCHRRLLAEILVGCGAHDAGER